ncbi:S-layer protein precursor [Metalysinibacillus saudimassiliensis]|uniref:S-layer protein n=1 Tax=Metalysinibacillus saudimassiliensis TaxID=1461583 RepID=A0A078MB24_9BACL|nr:S-layer protein precursor [Metalysinibacillus saudimassiliensis]
MANQPKKYQKFVATAATATLVASAIVPVASAAEKKFTDIERYAQETQDAIYSLVDRGVITGKSDSIFAPAESITRGQVVKMLGRYLVNEGVAEVPADWASKVRFTDLPVNYKDQDLVKNAAVVFDNGVFKGSNGKLNASNNISRENMALVLDRAITALNGKSLVQLAKEEGLKGNVKDLNTAKAEARDAILALNAFGISAVDNFNPKTDVNRAQFALFLERTIESVLSDTTEQLVEKAVVAGNALPKPEDVTKDNAADAQEKVDYAQKALDKAQKALNEDKELNSEQKLALQQKLDKVKDQIAAVKKAIEDTKVEAGIKSAKAINDTLVEVKFGKELDRDFIREAELSGKYFVVYAEGETVRGNVIKSEKINFNKDGKSAEFNLQKSIESGKKYYVALLDGANHEVADVVYTYGPTELKEATKTPEFEVSAVADKIYVKYSTKMKDAAKDVKNYTVYDEGGQKLGELVDFLEKGSEGKWVNLNDKKEVEFTLSKDSDKKLLAGKTYKLVVTADVKTDDNKTLAEDKRTIKVKTPSIDAASPAAKVARIVNEKTLDLIFDQDIVAPDGKVNLNKAQLNLKTTTGKTVDMDKFDKAVVEGDNKIRVTFDEKVFDKGLTYKVDMPANVVQNGIFTNAMNKATTELTAKAQDNVAIAGMKAQIIADPKNDAKADLVLTFDQVPNLKDFDQKEIVLYDGRDKYILNSDAKVKVYGGDTSGKSIIVEDVANFEMGNDALAVQADATYDIEIAKNTLKTDTFDDAVPAVNKEKLKASTKGISVSAPVVDKVRLQSAEKIEIQFEEDIKGDVSASDITLKAFVANRSDIFDGESTLKEVSGAGYYDVKLSGDKLTITAKEGVKFPTSLENLDVTIDKDSFTNTSGKVGNKEIKINDGSTSTVKAKNVVDNAAPMIVSVYAKNANTVEVTYSEDVALQGKEKDVASLFFADKGENASIGAEYSSNGNDKATITFKEKFAKASTDLSVVTLKYSKGNSYYIQDKSSNKMDTTTIKGFYKDSSSDLGSSSNVENGGNDDVASSSEFSALKAAITKANDVNTKGYTADSVKAFKDSITAAQKVYDNNKSTSKEVTNAKADLEKAQANLVKENETGDTVKASTLSAKAVAQTISVTTGVTIKVANLNEDQKNKKMTTTFKGQTYEFVENDMNPQLLEIVLPGSVTQADVDNLDITFTAK